MLKLTLINPNLENTQLDLIKIIHNVEWTLKIEIYIVGGWNVLGYSTAHEFLNDDYYSIVQRVAKQLKA